MATILGQIAASPLGNYENPNFDVAYQTQTFLGWPPSVNDTGLAVSGALTRQAPAPITPRAIPGQIALSYLQDFYNRIYFEPASVDLGAIANDGQFTLKVWNAYYDQPVTLSEVDYPTGLGVALVGPTEDVIFNPLEVKTYTVQYTSDGPVTIKGSFDWAFTGLSTYHLRLSGRRATIWPLLPNWGKASYQVTYRFSTEVIAASRTGKEQRRALRSLPRKHIEYTGTSARRDFQLLKMLLWDKQADTFVMPELTRSVLTQTGMGAGDTMVTVESIPPWLTAGVDIILRSGKALYIHSVSAVDTTARTITFAGGGETPVPAGAFVHPALAGNIATSVGANRQTSTVSEVVVDFDVTPLSEPAEDPGTPETILNGREVFLRRPNWARGMDVQSTHPTEVIDYGWGPTSVFVPVPFGTEMRKMSFLNRNRELATAIRKLFLRMKGRRGEFYAPTWEPDIAIASDLQALSNVLVSPGLELFDHFAGSSIHRALMLVPDTGDPILRTITKIEKSELVGEAVTSIQVAEPWGIDLPADRVTMVCWLLVWRFASDDLTFDWPTDTVAQVELNLQSLEDLAIETLPT